MFESFKKVFSALKHVNMARYDLIAAWPKSYNRKDTIVLQFLWKKVFIINRPEDVKRVMVSNADNYRKSLANREVLKPLLGSGLFVSEGELWSRQRKVMNPASHTSRLEGYSRIMMDAAQDKVLEWKKGAIGREVDLSEEMTLLTADIITRCMFGCELKEKGIILFEAFKEYLASHGRMHLTEIVGLPSWLPRPGQRRGVRAVKKFDTIIEYIIQQRLGSNEETHDDLLQMLLDFHDSSGEAMSRELIRDEIASIYLAGHETTAISLSWAFYLLHEHPDIRERLNEELDRVLGDRQPEFSDCKKLKFCRAIVDETLRLYPPVHVFSREALEKDQIAEYEVPKGSNMTISSWILHRHKNLWKDPNAFRPERFLSENAAEIKPYSYIPFGAGPRICLGKHFGLTELVLLLATFTRNFEFELRPGYEVVPYGRMTLRPKDGMPMVPRLKDKAIY